MSLLLKSGVTMVLALLLACSGGQQPDKGLQETSPKSTEALPEGEWISLFDGETLEGWKRYNAEMIGPLWKVEDGAILCTAAVRPTSESTCSIRRLYARKDVRGEGVALRMVNVIIAWARDNGYRSVEIWSDREFKRAHAFYEKMGFVPDGQSRDMSDSSKPYTELRFQIDL